MRKSRINLTIVLCFTLLFSGISLSAQSAKSILDNVSNAYSKRKTYYIHFEYKLSNTSKKINESFKGDFYASKEKYNLTFGDISQIYTGKKLYVIDREIEEITVSQPSKDSDDLLNPTKILGLYKTGYDISLDKKKTVDGKSIQYVKLVPKNNKEAGHYLVGINTKDNLIHEFVEYTKEGSTVSLTVKKHIENIRVPRQFFVFDKKKFKDYEITSI